MSAADRAARLSSGEARAARHAEASRLLRAAREEAGLTVAQVSAEAGTSPTVWRELEDPDHAKRAPLGDAMAPSIARHVVAALAARVGMVAVTLPAARVVHDDLAAIARVQRETSEAVSAHLDAISDGVIDRVENARVRAKIHAAIVELVTLSETLAATAHEPCTGVRRIGGSR